MKYIKKEKGKWVVYEYVSGPMSSETRSVVGKYSTKKEAQKSILKK